MVTCGIGLAGKLNNSMSLKYEPSSEALHISAKQLSVAESPLPDWMSIFSSANKSFETLQGYLVHKKQSPPRTLR